MKNNRFNAYTKTIYDFAENITVQCPNCQHKAIIIKNNFNPDKSNQAIRFSCISCGMNKFYNETNFEKIRLNNGKVYKIKTLSYGGNVDPYFKYSLWFQMQFSEGVLWAYNLEHLSFLEQHISSPLRERTNSPTLNTSIGSRLPKWITSKKNKNVLIDGIEQMKSSKFSPGNIDKIKGHIFIS